LISTRTYNVRRAGQVDNGEGGFTKGYVGIGDIRADIRNPSGGDIKIAQQMKGKVTHVIFARYLQSDIVNSVRNEDLIIDNLIETQYRVKVVINSWNWNISSKRILVEELQTDVV